MFWQNFWNHFYISGLCFRLFYSPYLSVIKSVLILITLYSCPLHTFILYYIHWRSWTQFSVCPYVCLSVGQLWTELDDISWQVRLIVTIAHRTFNLIFVGDLDILSVFWIPIVYGKRWYALYCVPTASRSRFTFLYSPKTFGWAYSRRFVHPSVSPNQSLSEA